jgi:hypothetical protein
VMVAVIMGMVMGVVVAHPGTRHTLSGARVCARERVIESSITGDSASLRGRFVGLVTRNPAVPSREPATSRNFGTPRTERPCGGSTDRRGRV